MKKYFTLMAMLTLAAFSAGAQKTDSASVIVHYKFSHLRDTTKPDNRYTENMMLLIGKSATAYKSYDNKLADLDVKKQVQEQIAANGGAGGPIRINRKRGGTGTEYYLFPEENKMVRKEKLINSYIIESDIPTMSWQISSDTASFGGLHCQKATTHFKGRDYTAWFCPDIPNHGGPWKLSGLPGLIVEAADAKKEVVFKFDGMEDISKMPASKPAAPQPTGGPVVKMIGMDDDADPRLIAIPADGIKVNDAEFLKLRDAMRKDPNAFAQSAMAGQGMGMPGGGPQTNIRMVVTPAVENNPIELPEKK